MEKAAGEGGKGRIFLREGEEQLKLQLRPGLSEKEMLRIMGPGNLLRLKGISAEDPEEVVDKDKLMHSINSIYLETKRDAGKKLLRQALEVFLNGHILDHIVSYGGNGQIDYTAFVKGEGERVFGKERWEAMADGMKDKFSTAVFVSENLPLKPKVADALNDATFEALVGYASMSNAIYRGRNFETEGESIAYAEKVRSEGMPYLQNMARSAVFDNKKFRDAYVNGARELDAMWMTEQIGATVFESVAERFATSRGYGAIVKIDLTKVNVASHLYFGRQGEAGGKFRHEGEIQVVDGVPKEAVVEVRLVENKDMQRLDEKVKEVIKEMFADYERGLSNAKIDMPVYMTIYVSEIMFRLEFGRYKFRAGYSDIYNAIGKLLEEGYIDDRGDKHPESGKKIVRSYVPEGMVRRSSS